LHEDTLENVDTDLRYPKSFQESNAETQFQSKTCDGNLLGRMKMVRKGKLVIQFGLMLARILVTDIYNVQRRNKKPAQNNQKWQEETGEIAGPSKTPSPYKCFNKTIK
jgi:hypothetical protein